MNGEFAGERRFRDDEGVEWHVARVLRQPKETTQREYLPDIWHDGWLVFECAEAKRRVAPVPPDWASLPDAELAALCRQGVVAVPVRPDRRERLRRPTDDAVGAAMRGRATPREVPAMAPAEPAAAGNAPVGVPATGPLRPRIRPRAGRTRGLTPPVGVPALPEPVDATPVEPTGLTVLVIDDDAAARYLMRRALGGVTVLEAADGREGLVVALDARPDVIILDYVLPDMTGGAVLDRLRIDGRTRAIPVLWYTTHEDVLGRDPRGRRGEGVIRKLQMDAQTTREQVLALAARPIA